MLISESCAASATYNQWYWTQQNVGDSSVYTIQTGQVQAFRLSTSTTVYVHCTVKLCLVDDSSCKLYKQVNFRLKCLTLHTLVYPQFLLTSGSQYRIRACNYFVTSFANEHCWKISNIDFIWSYLDIYWHYKHVIIRAASKVLLQMSESSVKVTSTYNLLVSLKMDKHNTFETISSRWKFLSYGKEWDNYFWRWLDQWSYCDSIAARWHQLQLVQYVIYRQNKN